MRLALTCPDCERKLAVEGLTVATVVSKRTCRHCHQRWQIVVKPLASKPGVTVHECTFARLEAFTA